MDVIQLSFFRMTTHCVYMEDAESLGRLSLFCKSEEGRDPYENNQPLVSVTFFCYCFVIIMNHLL